MSLYYTSIMSIISSINQKVKESFFKDNSISFLINPSYFNRKWIYQWIKNNSWFLSWKILDFWCGRKPYEHLFKYTEYIWLDIQESWHSHTTEEIDIFYDWKHIPFWDNYFDSVLISEVFEHVFTLDETIDEIVRVIKPGWNILITIPFIIGEHEQPYDFWRYTSFWITHILETHWLTIKEIQKKWTYIETIFQLINNYLFDILFVHFSNNVIKWILSLFFIFPLNVLWTLLSFILPNKTNTYLNLVILAQKK